MNDGFPVAFLFISLLVTVIGFSCMSYKDPNFHCTLNNSHKRAQAINDCLKLDSCKVTVADVKFLIDYQQKCKEFVK